MIDMSDQELRNVLQVTIDDEVVQPERQYPIAGIYGFGRGLFRRGPIYGDETSYQKLNRLTKGRFVMSRLKAFEGALAVIPPEFDGWYLSPEFPTFEIDANHADQRYLANLCAWPEFWSRLRAQSKGVGARKERVTADRLLAVNVPLPDLNEQRRIAARLDSSLSMLAAAKGKRERSNQLRRALHESVFDAEQGHRLVRLGDVLTLERFPVELAPDRYYVQIGIRSFGNGIFHRDKMPGAELSKLKYFQVKPNRLIVSNIMAWEGAIAVSTNSETDCIASSRFLSYMKSGDIDLRYLNHYFQCKYGRATIRNTSTGTVLRNQTLSIRDFENLKVPLPSVERQQKVASLLEKSTQLSNFGRVQDATISQLHTALLNAAFAGQL